MEGEDRIYNLFLNRGESCGHDRCEALWTALQPILDQVEDQNSDLFRALAIMAIYDTTRTDNADDIVVALANVAQMILDRVEQYFAILIEGLSGILAENDVQGLDALFKNHPEAWLN